MTDRGDARFGRCAHCGEPLELGEKYPVTTTREDGEFELYSFCSEDCQAAWEAER